MSDKKVIYQTAAPFGMPEDLYELLGLGFVKMDKRLLVSVVMTLGANLTMTLADHFEKETGNPVTEPEKARMFGTILAKVGMDLVDAAEDFERREGSAEEQADAAIFAAQEAARKATKH